jgi:hypothetical protein
MNNVLNIIFIMLIISISGCSTQRETDPLLVDDLSPSGFWSSASKSLGVNYEGVNSLSSTASRRIVILKQDPTAPKGKQVTLCSEPPPDVGEAFASAVSDAIKAAGSDPSGITASLSNDYARGAATQIAPLLYRTQGLQLYRDSIHGLCIDRLNGWYDAPNPTNNPVSVETTYTTKDKNGTTSVNSTINVNDYNQMKYFYFMKAMETIQVEVPLMLEAQKIYFQNVKAGVPISTVTDIANAVKGAGATTVTTSTPSATTTTTAQNPAKTPACTDGKPATGTPPVCSDGNPPK